MKKLLFILCLISFMACSSGNDEPEQPKEPETTIEINKSPINDFICSLAGDIKGLDAEGIIKKAVSNFNAENYLGKQLPFIKELKLELDPQDELSWGWHTFSIYPSDTFVDIPVHILVLVDVPTAEWDEYLTWAKKGGKFTIDGLVHDISFSYSETNKSVRFNIALGNQTIKKLQ